MQPRCSRVAAEIRPRYSRGTAALGDLPVDRLAQGTRVGVDQRRNCGRPLEDRHDVRPVPQQRNKLLHAQPVVTDCISHLWMDCNHGKGCTYVSFRVGPIGDLEQQLFGTLVASGQQIEQAIDATTAKKV